jgi:hypothetical protein
MSDINHEEFFKKHKELIQLVYEYDYYVSVFERAKELYTLDFSTVESICEFWDNFLVMLPKASHIQRDPFSKVCDMAEGKH